MSKLLEAHTRPLLKYLKRKDIVEICINKPGEVALELDSGEWEYKIEKDITLRGMLDFARALATASGQEFGPSVPTLATHIPGFGYRIQVMGDSIVESGIAISIRLALASRFPLETYFPGEPEKAAFLRQAVKDRRKILVCGGTSSGKTTFLNSLIPELSPELRIVVVEDTKELVVDHRNNVRIIKSKTGTDVAAIDWGSIINCCMRIRPDTLLLGEFAPENTVPFLRLLNTGHGGSMATLHADEPTSCIEAITTNAQVNNGNSSEKAIEKLARKAFHLVVHLTKITRKKYKVIIKEMKDL